MQPLIALYIADGITALLLAGGLFLCARKGLFGLFAFPAGLLSSFLLEYQLFSPAYGLAMRGLSSVLPILADPKAYAAAEVVFAALYETLAFSLLALIGRRKMRFSTAGAFGFGWWCCFALFTLVSRAVSLLTGEEYLFIGSALDVFLSRITIPLSLGLYMYLALSACRSVSEGRIRFVLRAFLMALLYRGVLASPSLFGVSEAVAVAIASILAFRMLSVLVGHGLASDYFARGRERSARETEEAEAREKEAPEPEETPEGPAEEEPEDLPEATEEPAGHADPSDGPAAETDGGNGRDAGTEFTGEETLSAEDVPEGEESADPAAGTDVPAEEEAPFPEGDDAEEKEEEPMFDLFDGDEADGRPRRGLFGRKR